LILLASSALTLPARADAQDTLALRCLDLSLTPWSGEREVADSLSFAPPPRVLLDTVPDDGPVPQWQRLREAQGSLPSIHRFAGLRRSADGDTLRLGWSTGFAGLTAVLLRQGEIFRGAESRSPM
jgi:hypothetical protein